LLPPHCPFLKPSGNDLDLNKQLTVDHALAHVFLSDRVTAQTKQAVPPEVKALVVSCYLEHKSQAYMALIGLIWQVRCRGREGTGADEPQPRAPHAAHSRSRDVM
jgi:hypothetical protein